MSPGSRARWAGRVCALALSVVLIGSSCNGQGADRPAAGEPCGGDEGPRTGVFRETKPAEVDKFEQWLGCPIDVVIDYSARDNWHEISTPTYLVKAWKGEPRTLVLGVAMLPEVEEASIEQGAAGEYDAHFRRLGQLLVDHGREDTILRVGWEFNLSASPWFTEDAEAFREYWRRIVRAMSVPGNDFVFDWNPNNGITPVDATDYYPGDDVVDVIGVDAYDHYGAGPYPYPDACDEACRASVQEHVWDESTYGGEHGLRFWSDFARKHGKPLSLPEWGLWDKPNGTGGGDDPVYLRHMHDFINDPVNNVLYQAYFEFNGIDGEHRLMTTFVGTGRMYRNLMTTGG